MIELAIPDKEQNNVGEIETFKTVESVRKRDNSRVGDILNLQSNQMDSVVEQLKENHEIQVSEGVSSRPDLRSIHRDHGDTRHQADVELNTVHPVPQSALRLVNPVPRVKRESGSTKRKRFGSTRSAQPVPPSFKGYKWKPSGLTGWELYTRKPSISATGKRSSTGRYLGYYSQEAVRILNESSKNKGLTDHGNQKTAKSRRA